MRLTHNSTPTIVRRTFHNCDDQMNLGIDELSARLSQDMALVKQMMGVSNNVAYYTLMQAVDIIKSKPGLYRQRVKQTVDAAVKSYKDYEASLLRPTDFFQMFNMDDARKGDLGRCYREDLTQEDYYTYWQMIGYRWFARHNDLLKAQAYKYVKPLRQHAPAVDAEATAWALVANNMLSIACLVRKECVTGLIRGSGIRRQLAERMTRTLSLDGVEAAWRRVVFAIAPEKQTSEALTDHERRNIDLGTEQIIDIMQDDEERYRCIYWAVQHSPDIFTSPESQAEVMEFVKRWVCHTKADKMVKNYAEAHPLATDEELALLKEQNENYLMTRPV